MIRTISVRSSLRHGQPGHVATLAWHNLNFQFFPLAADSQPDRSSDFRISQFGTGFERGDEGPVNGYQHVVLLQKICAWTFGVVVGDAGFHRKAMSDSSVA